MGAPMGVRAIQSQPMMVSTTRHTPINLSHQGMTRGRYSRYDVTRDGDRRRLWPDSEDKDSGEYHVGVPAAGNWNPYMGTNNPWDESGGSCGDALFATDICPKGDYTPDPSCDELPDENG